MDARSHPARSDKGARPTGLAGLWAQLADPPEGLAPSRKQRARLLLAMVVILTPLVLTLGLLMSWDPGSRTGWDLGLLAMLAGALGLFGASYALVRTGRYTLGAHVLVGGIWWLLFLEIVILEDPIDPWLYTYFLLPGFLSSILLTIPATLTISGGTIIALLLDWRTGGTTGGPTDVIYLLVLLTAVALGGHALQHGDHQRIQASKQRIRRLLNATFEAIVLHDGATIVDANPTFHDLFGVPVDQARGQRLDAFLEAEDEAAWAVLRDHVRAATTGSVECTGVGANGRRFDLECRSRPLDAPREGTRVTVFRDISDRKAIEQARAAEAEEAARRAELEELVWLTSHALRTPVRTVHSFSQLLDRQLDRQLDGRLDAEVAESLGYLQQGAAELNRLLTDLRQYAEVVTRDAPHQPVAVDVVVDLALASLREEVEASGAQVDRGPLPTVLADRVQLERLFRELLENALIHSGGQAPRIELVTRERRMHHRIEVRDHGPGIPPGLRERALEIFQRLGPPGPGPSTGIGLALAQRIAQAHGGSLELTETPGGKGGTTVVLKLPKAAEPASGGNRSPLS